VHGTGNDVGCDGGRHRLRLVGRLPTKSRAKRPATGRLLPAGGGANLRFCASPQVRPRTAIARATSGRWQGGPAPLTSQHKQFRRRRRFGGNLVLRFRLAPPLHAGQENACEESGLAVIAFNFPPRPVTPAWRGTCPHGPPIVKHSTLA